MLPENNLLEKFETEMWLLADGELSKERESFWLSKMEEHHELKRLYEENMLLLDEAGQSNTITMSDEELNERIKKLKSNQNFFVKVLSNLFGKLTQAQIDVMEIFRITPLKAAAITVVITIIVLNILTNSPFQITEINKQNFEWDAGKLNDEITNVEFRVKMATDEKFKEYVMKKLISDQWTSTVSLINNRIEEMKDEINSKNF